MSYKLTAVDSAGNTLTETFRHRWVALRALKTALAHGFAVTIEPTNTNREDVKES